MSLFSIGMEVEHVGLIPTSVKVLFGVSDYKSVASLFLGHKILGSYIYTVMLSKMSVRSG